MVTLVTPVVGIALSELGVHTTVAAALFLAASFCYEYLSLALLQQIGRNRGNVALVFAATAVVATVAYGISMLALS
jgi:hypothetical protein